VDPPNHRLFVARQSQVMVVDEDKGTLIGEVGNLHGAHGTAIAGTSGHGFVTDGEDKSVIMFDTKTLKTIQRIPAAEDADAIIYDAPSDRVFSFNGDAHSATAISSKGELVKTIPLGGKPEYAVSAGDGKVYVNMTDTNEIVEIDSQAANVERRWPAAACKQPVSMAIDHDHSRIFSGCRNGLLAISDYKAGRVIATAPIGMGVDGTAYDAASANLFASGGDGTLTVIHQDSADSYRVIQTVHTPQGSRNLGLDPATHRIFIPVATFAPAPPGRKRGSMLPGSFGLAIVEK
jgi:DNA-binding beta-propeller fold protein YncE